MSSKSRRIIRGNSHLTIYPWNHPASGAKRWRFTFTDPHGKRLTRTFKTKIDAETAAGQVLEQTPSGLQWAGLDLEARKFLEEVHRRTSPTERPAVLAFLRSRDSSATIDQAVAAYLSHKQAEAGERTPWLATCASVLEHLASHFPGRRVPDIHLPELAAWCADRGAGLSSKSQRDLRSTLITFWRWCLRQGLAGTDPITTPERLPAVKVAAGTKRILTVQELCAVLGEIDLDFRAWAVLGAFAGLRPEEIAPGPAKKSGKRGLHCEEIDWRFNCIRLPATVSKVNRPRIIPLNEALRAGLTWAGLMPGMTGPTTPKNPSQAKELARLGKLLFSGAWPKDALRHSFGSYRNSMLRNLGQVAEEMGTSIPMLHRHYHNPQPEELGAQWFSARPNCSTNDPQKWSFIADPESDAAPGNLATTGIAV